MPALQGGSNGQAFALSIQGVNLTRQVPAGSVRISEVGEGSVSTMEFDVEYSAIGANGWEWANGLSNNVLLVNTTTNRKLFSGGTVNTIRRHQAGRRVLLHITAQDANSWLDRLVLPKWISKRPNGTAIGTDREMVQNLTAAIANTPPGGFGWDAINTYVDLTNASMPVVKVDQGGSARDILNAIAEAAATTADPTARHFYVDFDNHLHWYKGSPTSAAPYIIGDASYTAVVKATSGLVSLWPLRYDSATQTDTMGYADLSLFNGYTTGVDPIVPNEPAMRALTFGGTGFGVATGNDLHPGDGPWSVELWFARSTLGTTQTMVSADTGDYEIGFNSSNQIVVYKEGTGTNFVTDATYTDTNAHHLVVVRPSGGPTVVYVDGASKVGTTTARTFVASNTSLAIGRRVSGSDREFVGTLQNVAIYDEALSAATVLAHYNDGVTLAADDFEFESDINDAGKHVYIKGGKAAGTGWVSLPTNSTYNQSFLLDRSQSTTAALKSAIGLGFLKREAKPVHSGRAVVTGYDGWRAGQLLTIDNASLGIPSGTTWAVPSTYEIKQVNTYPNFGSGVITYEIYFGALPWSGVFDVQRKRRRGGKG